jgi:hypothetical protein
MRMVTRPTVILSQQSTAQEFSGQVQDLGSSGILAYPELRHELPSDSRAGIPLECNMKTPFSVYKSGYVRLQPFLLIDRTWRFVTALSVHVRIVRSGCFTTCKERVAQDTYGVSSK